MPHALQIVKQIEGVLVENDITPQHSLLPVKPKPKTLASRSWKVKAAEYQAVKAAERAVEDAWAGRLTPQQDHR